MAYEIRLSPISQVINLFHFVKNITTEKYALQRVLLLLLKQ